MDYFELGFEKEAAVVVSPMPGVDRDYKRWLGSPEKKKGMPFPKYHAKASKIRFGKGMLGAGALTLGSAGAYHLYNKRRKR